MTTAAMTVTALACDRGRRDGTAYLARALAVRAVLAAGAMIGAAFGIYSH